MGRVLVDNRTEPSQYNLACNDLYYDRSVFGYEKRSCFVGIRAYGGSGIRRKLCKALVLFSYSYHCNRHRLRFISAFMRKTLGIKELIYFYWVYPGKEHVYENKTYFKYSLKLNAVSRYINAVYFRFGRYAGRPAGE